ncbi:hypothetical protein BC831DRAFT_493859 [Entophlyctis helioformis]|nr:hypothetical protein BC831DRAFT_493859 [Entophlyctis helioformis]
MQHLADQQVSQMASDKSLACCRWKACDRCIQPALNALSMSADPCPAARSLLPSLSRPPICCRATCRVRVGDALASRRVFPRVNWCLLVNRLTGFGQPRQRAAGWHGRLRGGSDAGRLEGMAEVRAGGSGASTPSAANTNPQPLGTRLRSLLLRSSCCCA